MSKIIFGKLLLHLLLEWHIHLHLTLYIIQRRLTFNRLCLCIFNCLIFPRRVDFKDLSKYAYEERPFSVLEGIASRAINSWRRRREDGAFTFITFLICSAVVRCRPWLWHWTQWLNPKRDEAWWLEVARLETWLDKSFSVRSRFHSSSCKSPNVCTYRQRKKYESLRCLRLKM